jgi:hypothetical protein
MPERLADLSLIRRAASHGPEAGSRLRTDAFNDNEID